MEPLLKIDEDKGVGWEAQDSSRVECADVEAPLQCSHSNRSWVAWDIEQISFLSLTLLLVIKPGPSTMTDGPHVNIVF